MIIADYIGNLALEAGKSHLKDDIDKKKLRKALSDLIKRHRKYNEICARAEEIDFQGLIDYIEGNLLNDVVTRIFNHDKAKRREARNSVIKKAIEYSHAKTDESKRRVAIIISFCLDIIHDFYLTLNNQDYIIASHIIDEINNDTKETVQSSEKRIANLVEHNRPLVSMDKAVELSKLGDLNTIENGIKDMLDVISTKHPLYPYYGYELHNSKLRSKPLTNEAIQKYPPKYVFSGPITVGDKQFHTPQENPFDYSYRHQLPMTLEVSGAIKYLGTQPDPKQDEMINLIGKTLTANPPGFPPASPYSIMVGTQTYFDYILLRTQEILDDGTIIISNKEQGYFITFEIKLNPKSLDNIKYIISMNHPSNHDLLKYVKFMAALEKNIDFRIHDLSKDTDWLAGHINNTGYKTGFPTIEEEISFIENLCCIEDYFNIQFHPEGNISISEMKDVQYLSNLIQNDYTYSTWEQSTLTGVIDQDKRDYILTMDDKPFMFAYVGISQISLFGAKFDVQFLRIYISAKVADLETLKKKVELSDDGESIKIKLQPGDNNYSADTLNIPDNISEAQSLFFSSEGQFSQMNSNN